jgi:predicted deacetylase
MELNVVIPIDDTHPQSGWGVDGDECTDILFKLNEEFGCKFVQFIPSNYHGEFPLSKYKEWINFWKEIDWIELAAHGHFHKREVIDSTCRECEFLDLNYEQAEDRIKQCFDEWSSVGVKPRGWRMPGWVATQDSFNVISKYFDYVAIHGNLNDTIKINNIKVFKGENSISNTNSLNFMGNTILFQSHINGKYNKNNWDSDNYEIFRTILSYLIDSGYKLNFKTFQELL